MGLLRKIRVSPRVFVSRKGLGSPVGHKCDTRECGGDACVNMTINIQTRDQSTLTGKLFMLVSLA